MALLWVGSSHLLDPAISRMQICIWTSAAYRGQGTLNEQGERRTGTQGPSPWACQQAAGGEQEQPWGEVTQGDCTLVQGAGWAVPDVPTGRVVRTRMTGLSSMAIRKENGWKWQPGEGKDSGP